MKTEIHVSHKNTIRRLILRCIALSVVLVPLLTGTAGFGAKAAMNDLTVDSASTGYTVDGNGNVEINVSGTYTITGNGNPTTSTIMVDGSLTTDVNITLNNVNIDGTSSSACAFSIGAGTTVNLTLNGTNALKSGGNNAGLCVPSGATLTITGSNTDSLTATGSSVGIYAGGSGIGGNTSETGGTITISGGIVAATGGASGAGIGGGFYGDGGTITISGGTVTAISTANGAGIGGGYCRSGGTIIISGGTVTATGGATGSGIGGGYSGNGGTTTISGGSVTATGGDHATGIGSGEYGRGGTTTISGTGTSVTATGAGGYADIGWCADISEGDGGTLTVGDANTTSPLPKITLTSKGTNTATHSYKNCTVAGSGAVANSIAGNYSADGIIIPTVVFDKNGGDTDASPASVIVETGATATLPTNPTRAGYHFTGWKTQNGTIFTASTLVTADITVYAQWAPNTYSIAYNLNSGTNSSDNTATSYTYHNPAIQLGSLTRSGYAFGGWYTNFGFTGTAVNAINDTLASRYSNGDTITLYANWLASTYSIAYNLNGGTNNPGNTATSYTYGSSAIQLGSPTCSGYTFEGWYTNSGFTASAVNAIDDTLAGRYSNGDTVTLYAKWTSSYIAPPASTDVSNGGTTTENSDETTSTTNTSTFRNTLQALQKRISCILTQLPEHLRIWALYLIIQQRP
jgi:uncharacterized repeat protein (TIGR02543 family)